jgi:hypothetical protein
MTEERFGKKDLQSIHKEADVNNGDHSFWESKWFLVSLVVIFFVLVVGGLLVLSSWRIFFSTNILEVSYEQQIEQLREENYNKDLQIARLQNQISCAPIVLTGSSFSVYLNRRTEFGFLDPVTYVEAGSVNNVTVPCANDASKICKVDFKILAEPDWKAKNNESQYFFFQEQEEDSVKYFGPFQDDLKRLLEESKG